MVSRLLLFLLLPTLLIAQDTCPPNHPQSKCSEPAVFILDVSSAMGTKENIETLFDWFSNVLLPKYDFENYQTIQLMTYGANSTPITQTRDYEKQVCPGMARLRQEALDHGLQDASFHDALKTMKKTFGDEYGAPVIVFSAANNQTDIDAASDYKSKHFSDEYYTVVSLNSSFKQWKYFYALVTYEVPIAQIFDYGNLDFCILDASCRDLESWCDITKPTTTSPVPKVTTPLPVVTTVASATQQQCQCNGVCTAADCYCPAGSISYKNDSDGLPLEGCYYSPSVTINFALARQKCIQMGGFLVSDESSDKQDFLYSSKIYSFNMPNFWLGLVYDTELQQYFWQDNSTLGYFQPWASNVKLPPSPGMGCVVADSAGQWLTVDCRVSAGVVCQLPPCDKRGYCNDLK